MKGGEKKIRVRGHNKICYAKASLNYIVGWVSTEIELFI